MLAHHFIALLMVRVVGLGLLELSRAASRCPQRSFSPRGPRAGSAMFGSNSISAPVLTLVVRGARAPVGVVCSFASSAIAARRVIGAGCLCLVYLGTAARRAGQLRWYRRLGVRRGAAFSPRLSRAVPAFSSPAKALEPGLVTPVRVRGASDKCGLPGGTGAAGRSGVQTHAHRVGRSPRRHLRQIQARHW